MQLHVRDDGKGHDCSVLAAADVRGGGGSVVRLDRSREKINGEGKQNTCAHE